MNKRFFILAIWMFVTVNTFAQKIFVWCPPKAEIGSANDKLKGLNIDIAIADFRKIVDTTHVECTSENLISIIAQTITTTYPAAIINILDTNQFKAAAEKQKVTIKIAVTAYHSAPGNDASDAIGKPEENFSWGALPKNKWNSVAGFNVVIEDYRSDTLKKLTRNIANIVSRPNIGGSLTAKKALFEAYKEANRELLYFIESTLQ